MLIEIDKVVSIHYTVKESGSSESIDSNIGGKPLDFIYGRGQVIKGMEDSLSGMKKGDNKEFTVAPEDAYGAYNDEMVQDVAKDQFNGIDLQTGMTLYGQNEDGSTIPVVVKSITDDVVVIDYNHPLAGKELSFYVDIVEVRDATDDEKASGQVMCDDRQSGGCGSGCGCH